MGTTRMRSSCPKPPPQQAVLKNGARSILDIDWDMKDQIGQGTRHLATCVP